MMKYLMFVVAWMLFFMAAGNFIADIYEYVNYDFEVYRSLLRWVVCSLSFAGWWMILKITR